MGSIQNSIGPAELGLAAICVRNPHNGLIAAECVHLTGGHPQQDGFAFCQRVTLIPQAAYLRTGLRLLAQGSTLDDLLSAVAQADFQAEDFRIDFLSLSGQNHLRPRRSVIALANVIPFYPNLDNPQNRFLLIERQQRLWFAQVLSECQYSFQQHDAKPYRTSTSLSSQLARALVNLVTPQARSLIDPCCGTGSILLEAHLLGLQTYGADANRETAWRARQNLAHFGYQVVVDHVEIQGCQRKADGLVTDLPYGRLLKTDENAIRSILDHGVKLAPLAVYVAGHDISAWLTAAGYDEIEVFTVNKHDRVVRYVHRAVVRQQYLHPVS
jgi:predicted RNA methylase